MIEHYAGVVTWGTLVWIVIAILSTLGIMAFINWYKKSRYTVTWYDWTIGIIGFGLLLFTIQNMYASYIENVPVAIWMFALVTGLPALLLLTLVWQLIIRRQKV
ncbi:hypothetical protein [Dehalococcoides mccartyi]|jgi:hypothetical protein|uniref:hypothetical protein n=1 Tax=Dehalococcoides mccartyi TaxID=61435 RepID=UPI0003C8973C|nr:hypothetical protein [Dehalococcoides mccartyi]AHB12909.1 reductive dehalogenase anchoring protein [Dehalococcoides mccartyi GY50]